MKKISLLDEALFAYLEALNDPNWVADWAAPQRAERALIRWDDALFSAGVYRLAAQGRAAILAEAATATEDQWTAFTLATLLTQSSSYDADVFLKLSQAKTYEDRAAIRIEAGDGVHGLTSLTEDHLHVAKLYEKKVNKEAETQAREDTIPAMMAQQAAPAAKTRKRGGVTQKEAAKICGVSVSTIRAWDRGEHTPEGYPGRGDAVLLKAFANRREEVKRMKAAVNGATRHGNMDAVSHRAERGGNW